MREVFEIPELVRVAIDDEASGVAFYGALAAKGWPHLGGFFADLTRQEEFHHKRFTTMLAEMGNYKPKEQYAGEFMEYLRVLTGSRAFPDADTARELAAKCDSPEEAINVATQFERDTLILLREMGPLIDPRDRAIVEDIAREEQAHLVALAAARRDLIRA